MKVLSERASIRSRRTYLVSHQHLETNLRDSKRRDVVQHADDHVYDLGLLTEQELGPGGPFHVAHEAPVLVVNSGPERVLAPAGLAVQVELRDSQAAGQRIVEGP